MSGVERIARLIVAALVVGVLPLVAWSGGCSSKLVQPDGSAGGNGGTSGASGTTGVGGTANARGGAGGTAGTGGTVPCCDPSSPDVCSADQHQLMTCQMALAPECHPPETYGYHLMVVDCPNGCVVTTGGGGRDAHCQGRGGAGGGTGQGGGGGYCCTGSSPDRCSANQSQLVQCQQDGVGGFGGCTSGYARSLVDCPNGCIATDAGASANDYCAAGGGGGRGGSGGAGQGGNGGQSGGGGGTSDGGVQCCGPGVPNTCTADGRGLQWCWYTAGMGCAATPGAYGYVMTVSDCLNGCTTSGGGTNGNDGPAHCQ